VSSEFIRKPIDRIHELDGDGRTDRHRMLTGRAYA